MKTGVIPSDGMVITEDTRFASGVYVLPGGLTIGADNVTIEGDDTHIVSGKSEGVGVYAQGRQNVVVRNLAISGYYHGLRFDECQHVMVENVKARETWEIEGINDFLYLWLPIEKVYGGAILLYRTQDAAIRTCDLQHQLNGVLIYQSARVTVDHCNASFNSGWGVYLSASNDCVVSDNQLDFCNRVYRRPEDGSIRVEADSAAIVLVKGSSRNQFLRNSCLCGGNGIFVVGFDYKEAIEPCNDNLFEDNDCRLSPNNSVEYSFCGGAIFRRNNCSRSNYGFWMGYSWDTVLEENEIEFSRWVGIASEHSHGFTVRNNRIRLNGEGVRLWTRGGGVLPYFPGSEVAYDFTLENNLIESNTIGFNAYTGAEMQGDECHDLHLRGNTIKDNRIGVQIERVKDCTLEANELTENVVAAIRLVGEPDVTIGSNTYAGNLADLIDV